MPEFVIDAVRIAHLLCFALGMGAGVYCDMRALRRLNTPFSDRDIVEFHRVHSFVSFALVGLWATGLVLIYIRTGFDLSAFSPKLWTKIAVVTVLTLNAVAIGHFVLPHISDHIGSRAVEMPLGTFVTMTVAASLSMFCWLGGVALGASKVLKTADWTLLGQVFSFGFVVVIGGTLLVALCLRHALARYDDAASSDAVTIPPR